MRPEITLAFDTSAAHCAAALLLPGDRVIQRVEPMEKGQAERLMPLLDDLLAEGGIGWSDLTRLAVGTGPGNFTGVRISVAAARGLALGLGIPALGVTRLEALAFGDHGPMLVAEDARRGMAYVQIFRPTGPASLVEAGVLPEGYPARAEPFVVGTLAAEYAAAQGLHAVEPAYPLAEAIARIAASRDPKDAPRPAPFYLRGADALPPSDPPPVILDA